MSTASTVDIVFDVPVDHPCFTGHFPGAPILPGALLLDEIVRHLPGLAAPVRLTGVKFRHPVQPGTRLLLRFAAREDGAVRFSAQDADVVVADGLASRG